LPGERRRHPIEVALGIEQQESLTLTGDRSFIVAQAIVA
jgi:hypothetical protein